MKVRIHCLLYFNLVFFFTNFAIFLKLCDQMRFEVNCAKSHHHVISDGLFLPSKPCSFPNTVNSLYDGHCEKGPCLRLIREIKFVIAGVYFSPMSIIYFCPGFSCCPYY